MPPVLGRAVARSVRWRPAIRWRPATDAGRRPPTATPTAAPAGTRPARRQHHDRADQPGHDSACRRPARHRDHAHQHRRRREVGGDHAAQLLPPVSPDADEQHRQQSDERLQRTQIAGVGAQHANRDPGQRDGVKLVSNSGQATARPRARPSIDHVTDVGYASADLVANDSQ